MLTITTSDALETTRARVNVLLQALLVAANVCVGALPHTLMIICVPRYADPEVWFDLPIHLDTPLVVAHQISTFPLASLPCPGTPPTHLSLFLFAAVPTHTYLIS